MKYSVLVAAILIAVMIIVSCASNGGEGDVTDPASENDSTTPALTGYPKGQVQRSFVFVNGTLYVDAEPTAEAGGISGVYHKVGTIVENDPYNVPSEELHAAHVEVGSAVYAADGYDRIFVSPEPGKHRAYVVCTDGDEWQP